MSGSFNAEKKAFRSAVIEKVMENTLDLINKEIFTLDNAKFQAIKLKIIPKAAQAQAQPQQQDINNIIAQYKSIATSQITEGKVTDKMVAEYILKKRAALVYMCMLYIKKLDESKTQETDKLKAIILQLDVLKKIVYQGLSKTITDTLQNANKTDQEKAMALIADITQNVTTLIEEKQKKDALFDDIIPFVATKAEVSAEEGVLND